MVSRNELYACLKAVLGDSGTDSPDFEARLIMSQAFGKSFPQLLMERDRMVDSETENLCLSMAKKRGEGYPLQYILGEWEFFGYPFKVGEGVLIPRPDTETLVEQVIEICRKNSLKTPKIADLCSGSGCIAVTLKKEIPDAQVTAVELSEKALPFIRENAELNSAEIEIVQADVLDEKSASALTDFDIIVSNPPYLTSQDMAALQTEVSFEPEMALFGGSDGLEFYRKISRIWRNSLKPDGFIAFEFGMGQHEAVSGILEGFGFKNIQLCRDTAGIIRTAAAQRNGGK